MAVVNDEIILSSDINEYREQLKKGKFIDDLIVENKDALMKDQNKLIKQLIDEKIIDSAVKQMGLAVTTEKMEQEIQNIARKNKISRLDLKSELKKEGISFSEYQNFIKQRLERQALIEKAVTSKIKITDDEVQAYYIAHNKNRIKESYEYSLAHIVFLNEKNGATLAKQKAEAIVKKIRSGENFEALAAQHSEDPNLTTGGFLGVFNSGEFLKELESGVRGVEVGSCSEPIKTKYGYEVVKVLSKKIISDPSFDKAKADIRNILYKDAFKNQFSFWLEQKRAEAFIKIN